MLLASTALAQTPDFHRYSVTVYAGPRAAPNFSGTDKQYLTYRTVIRDGFRYNPIAAGHFAIISAGCGAGCILYWYGDVRTGKIMTFPIGGEDYPDLTLTSTPGSRLLIAEWDNPQSGACTSRSYLLSGDQFFRSGPDRTMRSSCERRRP
jgi:hypothetical protein